MDVKIIRFDWRKRLCNALEANGQIDEAIAVLLECLQKSEDNIFALSALIGLYTKKQDFRSALTHLKQVLEADPSALEWIETDSLYEPLRRQPEYRTMIEEYGNESDWYCYRGKFKICERKNFEWRSK